MAVPKCFLEVVLLFLSLSILTEIKGWMFLSFIFDIFPSNTLKRKEFRVQTVKCDSAIK